MARKIVNFIGGKIRVQVRGVLDAGLPVYDAVIVQCSEGTHGTIEKVRLTSPGDWHNAVLVKSQFRRVKQ